MKVVLDSNIIIEDYYLQSAKFETILASSSNGLIELYLPEVVLDETFNKFQTLLEKFSTAIGVNKIEFERLARMKLSCSVPGDIISQACETYKSILLARLKKHSVCILPYPETSHKYLAGKAMMVKKPFNEKEKGYRDSLIWENLKSLLVVSKKSTGPSPQLSFITRNFRDFFTDELDLHDDLIAELGCENLSSASIIAFTSLNEFNREFLRVT